MIKAIITDIEGTTSSLSFVKDVLFPYARANLAKFIETNQNEPNVNNLLLETCLENGHSFDIEWLAAQFIAWIDEDQKITSLKALQGMIWEAGYQQGDFKGHVYPDASECLKDWKAKGISLYVYSSGSEQAQKLLFAYTEYGDLTPLFSGYFDTRIGHKRDPESYKNIAEKIGIPAEQLLFLSDIIEELDAAKSVGYKTAEINREELPDFLSDPIRAHNFYDINTAFLKSV